MAHITPVRTAVTENIVNEDGILVKSIEHFRQGDHAYRIIWLADENGELTGENIIEDETT